MSLNSTQPNSEVGTTQLKLVNLKNIHDGNVKSKFLVIYVANWDRKNGHKHNELDQMTQILKSGHNSLKLI